LGGRKVKKVSAHNEEIRPHKTWAALKALKFSTLRKGVGLLPEVVKLEQRTEKRDNSCY